MRGIEQRVSKLEQDVQIGAMCFIWGDVGETADEAISRAFPAGPPGDVTITIFRFAETPDDGRPG